MLNMIQLWSLILLRHPHEISNETHLLPIQQKLPQFDNKPGYNIAKKNRLLAG